VSLGGGTEPLGEAEQKSRKTANGPSVKENATKQDVLGPKRTMPRGKPELNEERGASNQAIPTAKRRNDLASSKKGISFNGVKARGGSE